MQRGLLSLNDSHYEALPDGRASAWGQADTSNGFQKASPNQIVFDRACIGFSTDRFVVES